MLTADIEYAITRERVGGDARVAISNASVTRSAVINRTMTTITPTMAADSYTT